MGNYLSDAYLKEPITDKISTDDDGERLRYGASSMQGWRVSQEVNICIYNINKCCLNTYSC